MCSDCLAQYGGPVPVTEPMRHAARKVADLYAFPGFGAGGPLHVEVEDMNVHLLEPDDRPDVERAWRELYPDSGQPGLDVALAAFDALVPLTLAERATVCCDYETVGRPA